MVRLEMMAEILLRQDTNELSETTERDKDTHSLGPLNGKIGAVDVGRGLVFKILEA